MQIRLDSIDGNPSNPKSKIYTLAHQRRDRLRRQLALHDRAAQLLQLGYYGGAVIGIDQRTSAELPACKLLAKLAQCLIGEAHIALEPPPRCPAPRRH